MKSGFRIPRFALAALTLPLLTGCLLKTATVSPRHFVLSSIPANETASTTTGDLSIEIGFVKMPSYLLRNSMAIRNGANEIDYFEDTQWAERLDHCFQRTLAANLSRLLSAETNQLANSVHSPRGVRVFIDVQQFDVDTRGHGTLIAHGRITAPESNTPLKTGDARMTRTGASPRGDPYVIATTLSSLTDDFSREMAQSIRDYVKSSR
jgi:uncharacterized lipoprotein YmbA